MYYAICDGVPGSNGPPFRFFKFKTLDSMEQCKEIDIYSIVYNGDEPRQLQEFCTKEELESICRSFGDNQEFYGHEQAARAVHEMTVKTAVHWKPPQKEDKQMSEATAVQVEAPTPVQGNPAPSSKQSRPRFNKDAKIVSLMDEPPLRAGTNRYRNMEVIMGSATVAEAMEKLRNLNPAPGGGVDIKIAIKAGAIKLEE